MPSDKFSVAILNPQSATIDPRLKNKLSPSSLGLVFHLPDKVSGESTISIEVAGSFYYRVFPTFDHQIRFSGDSRTVTGEVPLLAVFRKKNFTNSSIFKANEIVGDSKESQLSLTDSCENLWKSISGSDQFFKPFEMKRSRKGSSRVPSSALSNESEFHRFIATTNKSEMRCEWDLGLVLRSSKTPTGYRVTVILENRSDESGGDFRENSFFECRLTVKLSEGSFLPFELEYLEEDYRHNRAVFAQGFNCTAVQKSESEISTVHVPVYAEPRSTPKAPSCLEFTRLVSDPLTNLENAASLLRQSVDEFKSQRRSDLTLKQKEAFENDEAKSEEELQRFLRGIDILRTYPDSLSAFKWMCEAFQRSSKGISGWRLFQAVFIVSVIPDLVAAQHLEIQNSREYVDLLFYPTGGGKTEAFLGLAIFQAFFDRIRGKRAGVTAIAKFPLRMLSIQQLQRIADAFASAELTRRIHSKSMPQTSEPFSIGYYVGQRNTPNELEAWDDATKTYSLSKLREWERSPDLAQKFLVVSRCPFCLKEGVTVKADVSNVRLYHWCSSTGCPSGGPLPIFITDNEVYRYLPTFVVSTLDKMVTCGHQKKFRSLLGQVLYKCKLHGFTTEPKCNVRSCTARPGDVEPLRLEHPLPSLMIQDELHLVRESLGCFASHYETFLDYLTAQLAENHQRIKIIGATATASNYRAHVTQLYLREPIKFPANLELFTEKSGELARLTLGVMPNGKTAIFVMEQIIISLKSEIEKLSKMSLEESGKLLRTDPLPIIREELADFQTTLSYHIRKIDSEQLNRSVWSRINPSLAEDGYSEITRRNLTGDVTFDVVRKVMTQVEKGGGKEGVGLLTATSLISHGVDIDKLNLMVFMGMPPSNAEYIQARSRVARKSSGLVIVVFIPGRERDHSYYRYFVKFHELYDLLVEPIPINRWAPLAVTRTSVGIFTSSIYNYFDLVTTRDSNRPIWRVEWLRRGLSDKLVNQDDITKFVLASYGTHVLQGTTRQYVEETLRNKVDSFITSILTTEKKWDLIARVLEPPPLTSLRDIGADVSIELDNETRAIVDGFKVNAEISEV